MVVNKEGMFGAGSGRKSERAGGWEKGSERRGERVEGRCERVRNKYQKGFQDFLFFEGVKNPRDLLLLVLLSYSSGTHCGKESLSI